MADKGSGDKITKWYCHSCRVVDPPSTEITKFLRCCNRCGTKVEKIDETNDEDTTKKG